MKRKNRKSLAPASRPTIRRSRICVFTQPPPFAEVRLGVLMPYRDGWISGSINHAVSERHVGLVGLIATWQGADPPHARSDLDPYQNSMSQ